MNPRYPHPLAYQEEGRGRQKQIRSLLGKAHVHGGSLKNGCPYANTVPPCLCPSRGPRQDCTCMCMNSSVNNMMAGFRGQQKSHGHQEAANGGAMAIGAVMGVEPCSVGGALENTGQG